MDVRIKRWELLLPCLAFNIERDRATSIWRCSVAAGPTINWAKRFPFRTIKLLLLLLLLLLLFSDFYCIGKHIFSGISDYSRLFQTFPHRCSNTPVTCSYDHLHRGGGGGGVGGGGLALELGRGHTYTVNGPYGPHTPISVYLRVIFLAPHTRTHVLCMVSGSATGFFPAVRLVHSSYALHSSFAKKIFFFFFFFQLWYWIQVYTTKYSNLILIFRY